MSQRLKTALEALMPALVRPGGASPDGRRP
jgi:hypothetical protein